MLKKNFPEAVARNTLFLQRNLNDGVLFRAHVKNNPYAAQEERDDEWTDRECLSVSDREWVIESCRRAVSVYRDVDDDTIPEAYPTAHFGESVYSAMLGGDVRFVGNGYQTCSGAKPLLREAADLESLRDYEKNRWVTVFAESARYFAKAAGGDFTLRYFITIDALNLAVELLGSTEAYYALYENEDLLKKIMEFGVGYNHWFYTFQKQIYEANNRAALGNDFYDLYDRTWHSVDAYDVCDPAMYAAFGFEYQQELIARTGGGMLHTHGTGLLRLLPYITKLKGLSALQIGRDLYSGEELEISHLRDIRRATGDIPLRTSVSVEEFINGVKERSLPGGVEYNCAVETVDEANRLAAIAKEYRAY